MKFSTITNCLFTAIFTVSASVCAMHSPMSDGISNDAVWQGIERRCALESTQSTSPLFTQKLEALATGKQSQLQVTDLVVRDVLGRLRTINIVLYGLNQVATKNSFPQ
jgi:hypothetical protein